MSICQRCGSEHNGSYGSGRFCSKVCAFTKNENQLRSLRKSKSEETKEKMRKPKKDSSKMGKRDKHGNKNPNSKETHDSLKNRSGLQYKNVCLANKHNGQGWTQENINDHSEKMLGESNWMRGKKHSKESIDKIKESIKKRYESGIFNSFTYAISKAEREIANFLNERSIIFKHQYTIEGNPHRYDFYFPTTNLILEYYGDFWHANPEKYVSTSLIGRGQNKCLASEKWEDDKRKNEFAKFHGFTLMILWESEFNKNKTKILQKLYEDNFLGS